MNVEDNTDYNDDDDDKKCIDDDDECPLINNNNENAYRNEEFDHDINQKNDSENNNNHPVNSKMGYILRKKPSIIRYVKYNEQKEKSNYCREHLMLFYPWRRRRFDKCRCSKFVSRVL